MLGASLQRDLSFQHTYILQAPTAVPSDGKACFRPAQGARVRVGGTVLAPYGQCWDTVVHAKEDPETNPWKQGLVRGVAPHSVCACPGAAVTKSHRLGSFNSGHLLFLSLEAGVRDQGIGRVCSFQGL